MKIRKSEIIASSIIIILFITVLFMPKIIEVIPSEKVRTVVTVLLYVLVLIGIVFTAYDNIRRKEYTTTILICITDIIVIAAYGAFGYITLKYNDVTDIDALIQKNDILLYIRIFFFSAILIRAFLTGNSFKKVKENI